MMDRKVPERGMSSLTSATRTSRRPRLDGRRLRRASSCWPSCAIFVRRAGACGPMFCEFPLGQHTPARPPLRTKRGHDISADMRQRRFHSGVRDLAELYHPPLDWWRRQDNTGDLPHPSWRSWTAGLRWPGQNVLT